MRKNLTDENRVIAGRMNTLARALQCRGTIVEYRQPELRHVPVNAGKSVVNVAGKGAAGVGLLGTEHVHGEPFSVHIVIQMYRPVLQAPEDQWRGQRYRVE